MDKLLEYIYDNITITILEDEKKMLWFCANNIAQILEYKAPKKAIQKYVLKNQKKQYNELRKDDKIHPFTMFINEIGMYRLVLKSKQEKATEFQNWITDVVLPNIRSSGYYVLPTHIKHNISLLLNKYFKLKDENKVLKDLLTNNKNAKNGIIYVKKVDTINNQIIYKIGFTYDSIKREKTYKTGNTVTNDYIYFIEVSDPQYIENMIKRKLYKYQVNSTTELFNCSLDIIKEVLNAAKHFYEFPLNDDIMTNSVTSEDDTDIINTITSSFN